MKRGFTLIEVLIVVIILGILATMAIPQFSKMTKRARLAEAWTGLSGIRTAQAVYYMEWDSYTSDMNKLDFDTPTASNFNYTSPQGNATYFNAYAAGKAAPNPASGITAWLLNNGDKGSGI